MNKKRKTLAFRYTIGLFIIGVILIVSISLSSYFILRAVFIDEFSKVAFDYAKTASAYIDGDIVKEYAETGKMDRDYYNSILKFMNSARENGRLKFFYVFIPLEDRIKYVWDAENGGEQAELGYIDDYTENGGYELTQKAFRRDPVEKARVLEDKYGVVITSLYPIFDSQGEPVAVVGVDILSTTMNGRVLRILLYIMAIIVVIILLSMICFYVVTNKSIIQPIYQLKSAAAQMVDKIDSDEDFSINLESANEIGDLADSIEKMYGELKNYIAENNSITAEKERIGAELSLATKIQANMLPSIFPPFPERTEFDIYAIMDPAKEVGGDFYDFFLVDEDHLGLVMADVSGKGVPAALFMMMAKILVSNFAMQGYSPSEVLAQANDVICKNNVENLFVTVWLGILEISTGRIVAANAGHEYPVIRTANGEFDIYKDRHGFVVGGMEGMKYREYEFALEKGGALFLYTDGVPEATDKDNELFGNERMVDALNLDKDASAEGLLGNVRKAVDDFVGEAPQFDDLTMMAVKLYK